jgi:signal transduction histidine kinase
MPNVSSSPRRPRAARWSSSLPFLFAIRTRVFLSMALLAALLLLVLAFFIEPQARLELEGELTHRLQAVGEAAVDLVTPGVVPALLGLSPEQESFPFYRDRRTVLIRLRDRTQVHRIFLADTTGRSFVDTDARVPIATPLPQLRSDRFEMREIRAGHPASGALFTDEAGEIRKTGYVPVLLKGEVIALIGVEADATFLRAVQVLRRRILGIGAAGIVLAFVLAAAVARGLTRPLGQLVGWARRLGAGDLSQPVPVAGRDEIAFLGQTLEQMRIDLEARDREQRAMVAGVAHEIRNPLGGIRLYAELLASDAAMGPEPKARLEKILKELDHLGAIVEEFLLYARPGAPALQMVPVGEAVDELAEWCRPLAEQRGVTLAADSKAPPDALLQADPTHLRQILRNLIQNAIDASPPGGTVRIQVRPAARGIRIAVEDEGAGIDPVVRERIFEPFFTTKTHGAGLGLAIVRRLAMLNRARVEVEAPETGGARFSLVFPEVP